MNTPHKVFNDIFSVGIVENNVKKMQETKRSFFILDTHNDQNILGCTTSSMFGKIRKLTS